MSAQGELKTRGERRVEKRELDGGSGSLEGRDQLIAEYHDFVDVLVTRLSRAMGLPLSLREDFVAAGFLGLVEAASRFNTKKGKDFKAFAFLRVRGAIIDHIRDSCELSGPSYRLLKALEGAQTVREEELQRDPCPSPHGRVRTAKAIDSISKSAVAFKVVYAIDDHAIREGVDPTDPEADLCRKDMGQKIRQVIATLPEKERTILEQHYFHDKRLGEVAGCLSGLSKSWVSRLHERALEMLRDKLVEQGIVDQEAA